jgi:flagellar basal body rod protein FlgG
LSGKDSATRVGYHPFVDGIAWAASAMIAARTRLEIATENLANVSTDGFRRVSARGFLTALGVAIRRERSGKRTVETRAGAFVREPDGSLRDASGRRIAGPRLSNGVDAIAEMIDVVAAERSFESAQKAVTAIDLSRQKAAESARIS